MEMVLGKLSGRYTHGGMSFDLGVWYSERPLTDKEAADIYLNLCQNWPFLEGDKPNVVAFYNELIQRWPEIDTVPEEKIDDTNYCPWSCALDHSGMAVVMPCVWPMADAVATFVRGLASTHALVLFDPQANRVHLPDHLKVERRGFFKRFGRL